MQSNPESRNIVHKFDECLGSARCPRFICTRTSAFQRQDMAPSSGGSEEEVSYFRWLVIEIPPSLHTHIHTHAR